MNDGMKEFCMYLGGLLATTVMIAVPILCTCSFVFGWDMQGTVAPMVLLTILDYIATWGCVMATIKDIGG